jgi:hypothetical protein
MLTPATTLCTSTAADTAAIAVAIIVSINLLQVIVEAFERRQHAFSPRQTKRQLLQVVFPEKQEGSWLYKQHGARRLRHPFFAVAVQKVSGRQEPAKRLARAQAARAGLVHPCSVAVAFLVELVVAGPVAVSAHEGLARARVPAHGAEELYGRRKVFGQTLQRLAMTPDWGSRAPSETP